MCHVCGHLLVHDTDKQVSIAIFTGERGLPASSWLNGFRLGCVDHGFTDLIIILELRKCY